MAEVKGAELIARVIKEQGIQEIFGILGVPVGEIALRAQLQGIRYIGTRHEQTAGFAAQAAGYLRGHVGVALTVSGPGMTNAITAMGNAHANAWPLIVIGGSSDQPLNHRGAFQEAPQVDYARPFCKWVGQARRVEDIPRLFALAVRHAWYGRPGPTYLDLPADVIDGVVEEDALEPVERVPPPPRQAAPPELIEQALDVLRNAERPLVIVGKGAAWADAAPELRRLIDGAGLPFLATPMGKGVIPDDHPGSTAAARSHALQNADAILLAGARMNWMLHFGQEPRYQKGVKVVQIDISPEELGNNLPTAVGIAGDLKAVAGQMVARLEEEPWRHPADSPWVNALTEKSAARREQMEAALTSDEQPMNYYRPLAEINKALPADALLIAEGSNTMDIARTVLESHQPRSRLDAGSWGTMGVGCGMALAAAIVHPERPVVAVMGDGAFGFSGMEVEVACRYKLPIVWVVINNNGIVLGEPDLPEDAPPAVWQFIPDARYEKIMEAFGGRGYHCTTGEELAAALGQALAAKEPALIHVPIHPRASRAAQSHQWLSR